MGGPCTCAHALNYCIGGFQSFLLFSLRKEKKRNRITTVLVLAYVFVLVLVFVFVFVFVLVLVLVLVFCLEISRNLEMSRLNPGTLRNPG